jgi:ABC-type sulfate transport system permease component
VISFVHAAGATGNIILLASRDTLTLSLLALEYSSLAVSDREAASIVSIFIMGMTFVGAILARLAASRFRIGSKGHPI